MTLAAECPPFNPGPVDRYKTTDFLQEDGALQLCRIIQKAWENVGHPEIRAHAVKIEAGKRWGSHWAVRIEGLINGAPIKAGKRVLTNPTIRDGGKN